MSLADENYIVLAWPDSTKDKETGYIKKIPIKPTVSYFLSDTCGLYTDDTF